MPTLQAFDGDTLEAALARVTEVCGPGARITQAEKVRSGGFAGFFARERFEVTVEVDATARPADPEVGAGAAPQGHADAPTAAVRPAPRSLLDLVEQVSDVERTAAAVPSPAAPAAPPCTAPRSDPAPSTERPTFREVLRGIAGEAGLLEHLDDQGAPDDVDDATAAAGVAAAVASAPAPWPTTPEAPAPSTFPLLAERDAFASLGVPGILVERLAPAPSTAQRLLAVLERIEVAPPVLARRGEVVVVVGSEGVVLEAAGLLAGELGQTVDDIVVAGPDETGFHTLADPGSAAQRRALWRRCGVPFVVAMHAPAGEAGETWARDVIEALDPVTVWGAVTARQKPEDIAAWAERIGGLDALAVTGCHGTVSPAAVLGAGIPVALVEGRHATPAAWTALLVERLTM